MSSPFSEIASLTLKRVVAEDYGMSVRAMLSDTRRREIASVRMVAMFMHYLAWPDSTLAAIGRSFRRPDGGSQRDRTTVFHAVNCVRLRMLNDVAYAQALVGLGDKINSAMAVGKKYGWVTDAMTACQSQPDRLVDAAPCFIDPNPLDRSIT